MKISLNKDDESKGQALLMQKTIVSPFVAKYLDTCGMEELNRVCGVLVEFLTFLRQHHRLTDRHEVVGITKEQQDVLDAIDDTTLAVWKGFYASLEHVHIVRAAHEQSSGAIARLYTSLISLAAETESIFLSSQIKVPRAKDIFLGISGHLAKPTIKLSVLLHFLQEGGVVAVRLIKDEPAVADAVIKGWLSCDLCALAAGSSALDSGAFVTSLRQLTEEVFHLDFFSGLLEHVAPWQETIAEGPVCAFARSLGAAASTDRRRHEGRSTSSPSAPLFPGRFLTEFIR